MKKFAAEVVFLEREIRLVIFSNMREIRLLDLFLWIILYYVF